MIQKTTTAVALKFFSIAILVQVVVTFPKLAMLGPLFKAWTGDEPNLLWSFFVPATSVLLGIGAAILIWKCANSLLKNGMEGKSELGGLSADRVMEIVFSCMGVYFFVYAARFFPQSLVQHLIDRNMGAHLLASKMDMVSKVLGMLFGILLFLVGFNWPRL